MPKAAKQIMEETLGLVEKYEPDKEAAEQIRRAFQFAEIAHADQKRATGEPYIYHPVRAGLTLAKMKMPANIIAATILHDVPEDTDYSIEDIEKDFGQNITNLVRGVTKLGKLKYRGVERYIENLRKMFMAMAEDLRVVFIKFADRLDNLETLEALPEKKRYRVALETMEIYAPIANRLGMFEMRGKLEDLSFKHVYPKEYLWTMSQLKERMEHKQHYIETVIRLTKNLLDKDGIQYISVHGRAKHLYSLYKKLLKYGKDISRIHDLIALRIVTKDIATCYAVLGAIHQQWKPMPGRFKDYIAQPKPNGYRSLHTSVFCENGEVVEFQIRDSEMHAESEYGIVAHWAYDETGKKETQKSQPLQWVNELMQIQKELEDKKHFSEIKESLKIDVFQNRLFVFTPKGDVIDLPEGATPVDFAFVIHSDLGNSCVGAMVNDQMVSLDHQLKSGDVIFIITDKNRKVASIDWLKFVKTRQARHHIKTAQKNKTSHLLNILKKR